MGHAPLRRSGPHPATASVPGRSVGLCGLGARPRHVPRFGQSKTLTKRAPTADAKNISRRHEAADEDAPGCWRFTGLIGVGSVPLGSLAHLPICASSVRLPTMYLPRHVKSRTEEAGVCTYTTCTSTGLNAQVCTGGKHVGILAHGGLSV